MAKVINRDVPIAEENTTLPASRQQICMTIGVKRWKTVQTMCMMIPKRNLPETKSQKRRRSRR